MSAHRDYKPAYERLRKEREDTVLAEQEAQLKKLSVDVGAGDTLSLDAKGRGHDLASNLWGEYCNDYVFGHLELIQLSALQKHLTQTNYNIDVRNHTVAM